MDPQQAQDLVQEATEAGMQTPEEWLDMGLARVDVCRWGGEARTSETRGAFKAANTLMQVAPQGLSVCLAAWCACAAPRASRQERWVSSQASAELPIMACADLAGIVLGMNWLLACLMHDLFTRMYQKDAFIWQDSQRVSGEHTSCCLRLLQQVMLSVP